MPSARGWDPGSSGMIAVFEGQKRFPQTPRDSHSLDDCGRLTKTGYFICYEKGTFLMS
jgi:hypothetical protein